MNYPITIIMKKAKKKIFKAVVIDAAAHTFVRPEIMAHWKKGYTLNVLAGTGNPLNPNPSKHNSLNLS